MTAILANEGQNDMANILHGAIDANLRIGLYTARSVYSKSTVLANITAATFSGYAVQTPTFAAFGLDANGKTQFAGVANVFTHNGGGTGNTVIGYYLYNTSTGFLYWLEDFGAPVTINSNGQHIDVMPNQYTGDLTTPY